MIRKAIFMLLAAVLYSASLYAVHLLVDNAGADVGTAARIVYKLKEDPSFIYTINQNGVKHGLAKDAPEEEHLRNDAYVCGPKFAVYSASAALYSISSIVWQGADPLSALFFTNLACFFGCAALIYLILMRSCGFGSSGFAILSPALFLSLPTLYFLVYYPTYLFMLTFFMLAAIYLVMRSCDNNEFSYARLFVSGIALGLTIGAGSQAAVCIFAGVVFTGIYAFSKRFFFKSLIIQALGMLAVVALSELIFQANGASLLKWVWLHTHENVYDNHLKEPFPFIPFIYFRILYDLQPLTLAVFIGALFASKLWWKNATTEGRSLVISLIITLAALSILPNTPLFRILFPFFIVLQLSIFIMAMNTKTKAVKYAIIALLLIETTVTLPPALFIRLGQTEHNSPILVFEDERKILRHFDYELPETTRGAKEQAGKPASGKRTPQVK